MLYSLGSKSNNNINSKKNRVTITYIKPYSLTTYFIEKLVFSLKFRPPRTRPALEASIM